MTNGGRREAGSSSLRFFSRWLRDPRHIGAVAPSGPALARAMAAEVNLERPGHVVELGPGTGPVTQALLSTGLGPDRLLLIERDVQLHALLHHRFPQLRILHGDAADIVSLLEHANVEQVAAVVSSLPLLTLPEKVQAAIFKGCFEVMPDGEFIQFTYAPGAPVSPPRQRRFGVEAERATTVWRNMPPATVWRFKRAKPG